MDAGMGSVGGLLAHAAARWRDRPAVDSPAATLTYGQLDAAVSAAAAALRFAGAEPGDAVAFALSHDAPLYTVPFVCSRAGVTGLLLDTSVPPAAWGRQLARARPRLLVADDAHAQRLGSAARGARVVAARTTLPLEAGGPGPGPDPDPAPGDPDRAIALLATSGTTGEPTLVRLTSRGLLHVGRAYLDLLDLGARERSFVVMPLTHIGALSTQTMTMPMVGGCNVLPARTGPEGALGRMADQHITLLDAAPAWLTLLTRDPPTPVPTWRTLVYGGAPMPAATVDRLATDHPSVAMFDVWGLSEAHGPITAQRYDRGRPAPAGTVGRPLTGLGVRAGGDSGPLPPGTVGELHVCGPSVGAGTLEDPHGGRRDGWLATGDLGSVASDGTVTITDRKKELILRGGYSISGREIELVLRGAEGITDAAALAVADGLGGEAVGVVVVTEPGHRVSDGVLRRLVAARIGPHAVPRRIARLDALPCTATGKIDKPALRSLFV